MKIIDCSACIGESSVNRLIVNHENYPVYEKVRQPKNAEELLAEMDYNGIDEAVVYHTTMLDVDARFGNPKLISEICGNENRLHGTLTMLPSISDKGFETETLYNMICKEKLFALRAFPKLFRFRLDAVTCGDTLQMLVEKNIPLYLSPDQGWDEIFYVLKEFPLLRVILTNYGLWGSDRYFYPLVKSYKNVYVDTSDFQEIIGLEAFVDKFGSERLLFGTNYPMDNMGGPLAVLFGAKITLKDKENIAYKNIERLMTERVLTRGK